MDGHALPTQQHRLRAYPLLLQAQSTHPPQNPASAQHIDLIEYLLERARRFERPTLTLARLDRPLSGCFP